VGDLTDALKSCFVADLGEHLEQLPAGGVGERRLRPNREPSLSAGMHPD
jgi:hypothetical protein